MTKTKELEIAEKAVFLRIRIGGFWSARALDQDQFSSEAQDQDAVTASKHLLKSEELNAIQRLQAEAGRWVRALCLPYEDGLHILPIGLIERCEAKLTEYNDSLYEKVETLVAALPRLKDEDRVKLGPLYREQDYPSTDDMRRKFTIYWQYLAFNTPDALKSISKTMFTAERAKLAGQMEETMTEIRQVLRVGCLELVTKLKDRLEPDGDGTKKILKGSVVEKLRGFLEDFNLKNITDDADLAEVVGQLKGILGGVTPEQLRESDNLRANVAQAVTSATARLEVITAGRKIRKFEPDAA